MKRYSVRCELFFFTGIFIAVMLLCMSLGNAYAVKLVRKQAYDANKNTINLYLKQLERGLDDVEVYLFNIGTYNQNLEAMATAQDTDQRILASYELNNLFYQNLQLYPAIDAFFAYSPKDNQYVFSQKKVKSWEEQEGLRKYIKDTAEQMQGDIPPNWVAEEIEGDYYFLKFTKKNEMLIGAWVSTETLLENLVTIEIAGLEHLLFLDEEGNPLSQEIFQEEDEIDFRQDFSNYYLTGKNHQYLVIGERSQKTEFQLTALLRDDRILEGLSTFRKLVIMLIAIAGAGGSLFLGFTRKKIAIPLKNLVNSMSDIQQKESEKEITKATKSNEFEWMNHTFHAMAEEIQNLKIHIYEEKIQRQKTQLDFYAIQVNPHFLINSMNIIYNFARMNQMNMIQEFTVCIVEQFRYTLYGNGIVHLEEEVEFTKNYLKMQRLRSFNQTDFELKIWIEEGMEKTTIPNLLLQGFVENSVKHTKADKGIVQVEIQAYQEETENGKFINIRIQDSGSGFDPEVLKILNAGEKLVDSRGEHIGIYNIRQRLKLLYGEETQLKFENRSPQGARVVIRFFQPWDREN